MADFLKMLLFIIPSMDKALKDSVHLSSSSVFVLTLEAFVKCALSF